MKHSFKRLMLPVAQLYWRVVKPKTFGVRVLLVDDAWSCLLVRHAYGNRHLWNIPGGGYNPRRETPEAAAIREVREEVGVILESVREVGSYSTTGEGKQDTVTLYFARIEDKTAIQPNAEIAEHSWQSIHEAQDRSDLARVGRRAIAAVIDIAR